MRYTKCNTQEAKPQIPKYPTALLRRRSNRHQAWLSGNRNPMTAALTYFAMIACDDDKIDMLLERHAKGKSPSEANYIERRTARIVKQRWAQARHAALNILRNHDDAKHWHTSSAHVLAAMMLFGWQTGYCWASQANIARRAGVSRGTANRWIRRLRDAGIIEQVSWSWAGLNDDGGVHWTCLEKLPEPQAVGAYAPSSGIWDSVNPSPKRRPRQPQSFYDLPKFVGFRLPCEEET